MSGKVSRLTRDFCKPDIDCLAGRGRYNPLGTDMDRLRLKHVMAIALSLWLGFLACVLCCVQPVFAASLSTHAQISRVRAAANEDAYDRMADIGLCCHQTGKTPEKNRQGTTNVSCCPLDATLIQKQDPVPPLRTYFSAIALPLFALDPLRCGSNPSVSGTVRD
jgi:hypothetical protein